MSLRRSNRLAAKPAVNYSEVKEEMKEVMEAVKAAEWDAAVERAEKAADAARAAEKEKKAATKAVKKAATKAVKKAMKTGNEAELKAALAREAEAMAALKEAELKAAYAWQEEAMADEVVDSYYCEYCGRHEEFGCSSDCHKYDKAFMRAAEKEAMSSSRAMKRELRRDLPSKSELEAKAAPKAVAPKVDAIQEAEKAVHELFVAWRKACNELDDLKAAYCVIPEKEEEPEVLSHFTFNCARYLISKRNECWLYEWENNALGAWVGIFDEATGSIKPAPEPVFDE